MILNITVRETDSEYVAFVDSNPEIEGLGETLSEAVRELADSIETVGAGYEFGV